MSALCWLLGLWWTTMQGGWWRGFRVSGHAFGEPVYDLIDERAWEVVPTSAYVGPAELERLVCERCGAVSEGWRPT